MKLSRWLPLLALAALSLWSQLAAAVPPAPNGYPRLSIYGSIRGNGYPFYEGPADSALRDSVLEQFARYEVVILDINPIEPYRRDIAAELKARNPDMKLLGYVVGHDIWNARDKDSTRHYPTRYRRMIDNTSGWLYSKVTGDKYYAGNVNLAKRDASGFLVVADSLARIWKEYAYDSGTFDGIFFDILCDDISWAQAEGDSIDYVRAGYPTIEAFNSSWREASELIAVQLRNWCGPDFIMVGNCALGTRYSLYNGWMREGFPFQAGGDWYSNMFWEPGGYFTDERNFQAPRYNYIFSFQVGTDYYSDTNCRIARFGLGSATLADGFGVFGVQSRDAFVDDYHSWWYDEYAVDPATGASSENPAHTGWLGQPLSSWYQMIWTNTGPDGVANPDFETSITPAWTFGGVMPGSRAERDTTTAAKGRTSARLTIPTSSSVDWHVNLATPIGLLITPWTTYSITFYAKATTPRTIPIVISNSSNQKLLDRTVTIGTEWKQYQVPFLSYGNFALAGQLKIGMFFAKDAGQVWLDDVHFQKGLSTAYRRDFQNGVVLVNPSQEDEASVVMERPFRRILGRRDPVVNNGTTSVQQLIPRLDALFLLGDDVHAPARVLDLQQVQPPN